MSNEKNEKNPTGSQNEKSTTPNSSPASEKQGNQNWDSKNAPKTSAKPVTGQNEKTDEQSKTSSSPESAQKSKQQPQASSNKPSGSSTPQNSRS